MNAYVGVKPITETMQNRPTCDLSIRALTHRTGTTERGLSVRTKQFIVLFLLYWEFLLKYAVQILVGTDITGISHKTHVHMTYLPLQRGQYKNHVRTKEAEETTNILNVTWRHTDAISTSYNWGKKI
jgi:hypothetical protein